MMMTVKILQHVGHAFPLMLPISCWCTSACWRAGSGPGSLFCLLENVLLDPLDRDTEHAIFVNAEPGSLGLVLFIAHKGLVLAKDGEEDGEQDEDRFADLALILLDQATLAQGSQLDDPASYVARMNKLLVEMSA